MNPRAHIAQRLDLRSDTLTLDDRPVAPCIHDIPILTHTHLHATADGALTITTTDMDVWLRQRLDAQADTAGTVTLDAQALHALAKAAPKGAQVRLALNAKTTRVRVDTGRTTVTLATLPADDWPTPPALGNDATYPAELDGAAFPATLGRVATAMSTEETRYYLCGIYIHRAGSSDTPHDAPHDAPDGTLRCVATDGHRLHRSDAAARFDQWDAGLLIPRYAVGLLRGLLDDSAPAALASDAQRLVVTQGTTELTTRLIDGQFPDYQRVIPAPAEQGVTFGVADLAAAIKRVT